MPKSKQSGVCQECGLPGCDLCTPAEPPPEVPAHDDSDELSEDEKILAIARSRHATGHAVAGNVLGGLLRMVDKLQSRPLFWSFKQACAELDELRAKLARANEDRRELIEQTVKLGASADMLRAKLAEALNGGYCPQCGDAGLTGLGTEQLDKLVTPYRARAEAAEARVMELESKPR
jgi:hypothetical protein